MTDEPRKKLKGHCPKCGPDRNADVMGEHRSEFRDEEFWANSTFRILVCCGCETAFFQIESVCSEDEDWDYDKEGDPYSYVTPHFHYYPSPIKREQPAWARRFDIDKSLAELGISDTGQLWNLFDDIYDCLNANLPIPAAIAIRTAFDKATEFVGISPALPFVKKLDALLELGRISEDEREVLEVLVDAGSAAAHRGWRPSPEDLETLTTLIENFLHRTFVLVDAARKVRSAIPPKPATRRKPKAT